MTHESTPSQAEGAREDDGPGTLPVDAEEEGGQRQVAQTTPSQAEGDRDDETDETDE